MAYWTVASERPLRWEVSGWEGIRAWFTSREGGVSLPPFDTMNLSYSVRDLKTAVRENRRRALLPANGRQPVFSRQVHGRDVVWVSSGSAKTTADGLFTTDVGAVLGMTFADCVPIFLADPQHRTAGIVHAGWRGTVGDIAGQAIQFLQEAGRQPENLVAAIGPSIGPCCYEVDERVAEAVRALGHGECFLAPSGAGHYHLDLWLLNRWLLTRAGVPDSAVLTSGICTACHPAWLFSHRKEAGRTGRMGGFICLV